MENSVTEYVMVENVAEVVAQLAIVDNNEVEETNVTATNEMCEKMDNPKVGKDVDEPGKMEELVYSDDESSSYEDNVLAYDSDLGEIPDHFFDVEIWEKIDKNLEDFTIDDMKKLSISSLDMCIQFYKMYAKVKGFGIRRKSTTYSSVNGLPTSQTLWCNRRGYREQKHLLRPDRKYKHRELTRCGCLAKICFKFNESNGKWNVKDFIEEHNHNLVPINQVAFVRSHREVTEADKLRIKCLINSGVSPCIAMRNFIQQAGGDPHDVGFLPEDLYNTYEKLKKEEIRDGDTETVMAYLLGKQSSSPGFFLRHTRNEYNGIDKLFWCDGRCRNDYKAFGRVIAFDATYKVNAYKKPFVVIVGVNHHRKTIPFAVALITNEKEETYRWVLEQLLEASENLVPYTVITDGDKAMANAIKAVFPGARHRLCLWHLMRNVKGNSSKSFCSGFMKCLDQCRTPEVFEEAWEQLVSHHKVQKEQWAINLYKDKEKWAECFMQGYFFAGMRSTQRCESMNSTLKTVLTKKIMLYKFMELYDHVLKRIRFVEDKDDYLTSHTLPVVQGVLSAVKTHAARTYTRASFRMLCKEMEYESRHIVMRSAEDKNHCDGPAKCYWLNDCEIEDSKYIVVYNQKLQKMFCCCMKLENIGYPCRHMFSVMKFEGMSEIPRGCILRRWTVWAKEHCLNQNEQLESYNAEDETATVGRFAFLNGLSNQLCRRAAFSYDRSLWLKDKFAKLIIETGDNDKGTPKKKKRKDQKTIGGKDRFKNKNDEEAAKNKNPTQTSKPIDSSLSDNSGGLPDMLKSFMPRSYSACFTSKTTESYEVSHFEKMPTVFDWEPKDHF